MTFDVFSNKFAHDIYLQKYSKDGQESWKDTAKRVTEAVCSQLLDSKTKEKIYNIILERKFIPGGRYLYSSGREFHQVNNCFDGDVRFITDSGIKSLKESVGESLKVKNWKGQWETAEVKSFGQQDLYKVTFSNGDTVLTTENHLWIQPDGSRIETKNLKRVMLTPGDVELKLDPEGIRHGIIFGDGYKNKKTGYCEMVIVNPKKDESLSSFFEKKEIEITVGFGAKRKYTTIRKTKQGTKIALQPEHYKDLPSNCTPEYARGFIAGLIATDGHASLGGSVLISCEGFEKAKKISELAVLGGCVVSSVRINSKINPYNGEPRELSNVYIKPFSAPIILPYHQKNMENRKFHHKEMYLSVVDVVSTGETREVYCVVAPQTHTFTLANGVLTSNCFLFRAEDSRESWADIMQKITSGLMTGGGIGVNYSKLREEGAKISRTGGKSTGPLALMHMVNESGRYIMQGGQRRSAIWAGLSWKHPDIFKYLHIKDYTDELKQAKLKDFTFPLPMELTNISVDYDTGFFIAIEDESHPLHTHAKKVWLENCKQAFSTAEPGMSFNFLKDNENLRNACQPGFATIETTDGEKKFSDIDVGSKVRSGYFKKDNPDYYTTVKKKWKTGNKEVLLFVLENGTHFIGTEDHKVVVATPNKEFHHKVPIIEAMLGGFDVYTTDEKQKYSKIKSHTSLGYHDVYDIEVEAETHTYVTGGVVVSNCTEVTSEDDSDKCNLGTIWINRIKDKKDLAEVTKYATLFLLCGSIYSDVPTDKIREVGDKNNRIGLGLGGIHEWLMARGYGYEVVPELHKWLSVYEQESNSSAFIGAKQLGVSVPKGVRAIAPNGTIGIIAETTTGIEPLFCKAYKRRYFKDGKWVYQYVVDGSVKRLLEKGVKLENIQDSYDLSFRQRVKFQADVQNYVDMAISSTCNMPPWGSDVNNETNYEKNADILLKYAKRLRGFTVYPDGCRGGQPLTRVSLEEALQSEGQVFEETENQCTNGVCGL